MKQLKVEAKKVKDIRDKEQLYVVLGEGEDKVVINVGQKTFDAVSKITNVKEETKKERA